MKKLPILAGSAAVFAVAVFYFRADPVPAPRADALSARAPVATQAGAVKPAVVSRRAEHQNTPRSQQPVPQAAPPEPAEPADEFPLPEPLMDDGAVHASEVDVWQLPQEETTVEVDGLPAVTLTLDPAVLSSLQVGQVVHFALPDGAGDIEAEIRQTYNDPTGVQVWKGRVKNDVNQASIIITRGEIQTHIVIATTQGNYSAVVDNRSGDGTLINESTIHSRQLPYDDGIVYRPGDAEATHQH